MKNRGMFLEELINLTNNFYIKQGIAVVHKRNLDITPTKILGFKVEGILRSRSTVDYFGCYNGKFIAFDCKQTAGDTFKKSFVKQHQEDYIKTINKTGGIAFIIVYFTKYKEGFVINDTSKNFTHKECKQLFPLLKITYPGVLDYLKHIK